MREHSGELQFLSSDFEIPEDAILGEYNTINLLPETDKRCANLARWFVGDLVEWTRSCVLVGGNDINADEMTELYDPGLFTIAETHSVIPLLAPDATTKDWLEIADNSKDFTKQFANAGTATQYAVRRWLSLRRTLTDYFEYDPNKLAVPDGKLSLQTSVEGVVDAAKLAAQDTGRPNNFCVALQAMVEIDGVPVTLYDGISMAFSRATDALVYPGISSEDIEAALIKSDRIRHPLKEGGSVHEQMASAICELP